MDKVKIILQRDKKYFVMVKNRLLDFPTGNLLGSLKVSSEIILGNEIGLMLPCYTRAFGMFLIEGVCVYFTKAVRISDWERKRVNAKYWDFMDRETLLSHDINNDVRAFLESFEHTWV